MSDDTASTILDPITTGAFLGTPVHSGRGGGLVTSPATASARTTHFHAARLPEFGDVVLAVTRAFDERTGAALAIELRAFGASAPGRGALAEMPLDALVQAPGTIAVAHVELSAPGDEADERRPATLLRCTVTDAAPTAAAARSVAEWLRSTWETELAFASWPAVRGTLAAFSPNGSDIAEWARDLLVEGEHRIDGEGVDARFVKVLSAAWLDPEADAQTDEATTGA